MSSRFFPNPFPSENPNFHAVDRNRVLQLISFYVKEIIQNVRPGAEQDRRGDLYVGHSGIAFMFLKMHQKSPELRGQFPCLVLAKQFMDSAKGFAKNYSKSADERCSFLCGNAGIYAVSTAISKEMGSQANMELDLANFTLGVEACKPINFNKYGSDEVLVGRAGFLSGIYWLKSQLKKNPIEEDQIVQICDSMLESGRIYSQRYNSKLKLMYQYHGSEYMGAAHGVSAILQMLLTAPHFGPDMPQNDYNDIKQSIDAYLAFQDAEGNFPIVLDDLREKRLVHWCHGAPGAIYLFAKAYLTYHEEKYLNSCKLSAELIWKKGLLKKGPGICHGVAGNGYALLLMYRLTENPMYLYRASKFMEFLCDPVFQREARTPDRPYSLYEGTAGTVCFLVDLLQPETSSFPFMDVFT